VIGDEHRISHVIINKRDVREEWTRDLCARIQPKATPLVLIQLLI